jgi:SAM-dependent methyltransferase
MAEGDRRFAGAIPEIYDRFLVPLLFEHYAADLARRMAERRPDAVLETAAGSGVVTRAAVPLLAPGARYVATDLNQPMLDRARSRLPEEGRVSWQQADALALPFDDAEFDIVLCQFGVMFFPDKATGFREARRVLRPGGVFLFSVFDRIEENDLALELHRAMGEMFPEDPPRFLLLPFSYCDRDRIRGDLGAAGFGEVTIDVVHATSRAGSAREPALGMAQGSPLRNEIEARDPARLDEATDRAEAAIRARFGSGPVEGRMQALMVTAHA